MNPEFLKQICGKCTKSLGVHAAQGDFCPSGDWYSETETFTPVETAVLEGA